MYTELPTDRRARGVMVCAAALALATPIAARAQDPARLPAVVSTAAIPKPGARAIAGIVRDSSALTLGQVEISIAALQRRAFSDLDGNFRLTDVSPGKYLVRARKIGYAPQSQEVVVDADGGVATFALVPQPRALPPVVVAAARGGLSGVVGDTAYNALPRTEVRLLGGGETAETDSTGHFFFAVKPGKYTLGVRRPGYADRVVSVIVPSDSGRRVSIWLQDRHGALSAREAHNIDDFASRLAWRNPTRTTVYTHEDLEHMGIEWIGDVVQGAVTLAGSKMQVDKQCVAVVNGGPATTQLSELTIDDVETVEVYPQASAPSNPNYNAGKMRKSQPAGTRRFASATPKIPLSNTDRADMQNGALDCATVYVWMR